MSATIKEVEAIPASYPSVPAGLSTEAEALNADAIWQRIEAYCRNRWTAREVVWTVEGPGSWEAPLSPATVSAVELWQNNAWVASTPDPSPLGGYELPGVGPYRITASVGSGDVPEAVSEAFRRLAEYLSDQSDRSGVSDFAIKLSDAIEETYRRSPAWVARAMDLSGAADLLRPYKRRA